MEIAGIQKYGMDHAGSTALSSIDNAAREVTEVVRQIDGPTIKDFYLNRGTDRMKSVSAPVNKLILEGLSNRGWELNWRFIDVKSQQATFEAAKIFDDGEGARIGLDIGSRHAMSALGFFVRATAASSSVPDGRSHCSGSILLAFTDKTVAWGLWNTGNSTFESLQGVATIAQPLMKKPLWLIGVDPAPGLQIESRASGTLRLNLV